MKWLLFPLLCLPLIGPAQKPEVGIVSDLEKDSLLKAMGYRYLTESVAKIFSPLRVSNEQFAVHLATIRRMNTKINACNIFIPPELKLVGPAVDSVALEKYVREVFRRCREAGIRMIVWGSGGARRLPDGYDPQKAKREFILLARKMAILAASYEITLALENINRSETNFITTVEEAQEIVKAVNHPNLRLSADIYHMLMENEDPEQIRKAGNLLVNCEIAEKEDRSPPGTHAYSFISYLGALRDTGYTGMITIECRWTNFPAQGYRAREYLVQQIDQVFN